MTTVSKITFSHLVLYSLSIILFLRHIAHAWHPDGGISVARQYVCPESINVTVGVIFMYGNTQLGLLIHDIYSLYNHDRINLCIHIHGLIATIHILVINILWTYIKSYPYPELPAEGLRPGGKLWYVEVVIYAVYLLFKSINKRSKLD